METRNTSSTAWFVALEGALSVATRDSICKQSLQTDKMLSHNQLILQHNKQQKGAYSKTNNTHQL